MASRVRGGRRHRRAAAEGGDDGGDEDLLTETEIEQRTVFSHLSVAWWVNNPKFTSSTPAPRFGRAPPEELHKKGGVELIFDGVEWSQI